MTQTARFLWIGPRLSAMERLCLKSFINVGYDVELYRYDHVEGGPTVSGTAMRQKSFRATRSSSASPGLAPTVTPSLPTH